MQLRATHPLAAEFGPANAATREAVRRLAAAREEPPPPEWTEVFGSVDDPRGELATALGETYGLAERGPLAPVLFAVHAYFALVARLVANGAIGDATRSRGAWTSRWPTTCATAPAGSRSAALPGTTCCATSTSSCCRRGCAVRWASSSRRSGSRRRACERLEETGAPLASGRVLDPDLRDGHLPRARAQPAARRAAGLGRGHGGAVQAVLDSVVGYDLNPVAVLAARANVVARAR